MSSKASSITHSLQVMKNKIWLKKIDKPSNTFLSWTKKILRKIHNAFTHYPKILNHPSLTPPMNKNINSKRWSPTLPLDKKLFCHSPLPPGPSLIQHHVIKVTNWRKTTKRDWILDSTKLKNRKTFNLQNFMIFAIKKWRKTKSESNASSLN